jgi:hypothetical protein
MDHLKRDGRPQTWIPETRSGASERTITAVAGNRLTVDIPLADSYDAQYLSPPGTIVAKVKPLAPVSEVGVEHLHIQCPPLEIAYGRAPYSAIQVGGDDVWVKDVFAEETMNSIATLGRRVTLQEVVITHTYPNLGASKPGDFSIEGSQILLDRCRATGGNTYFVWTSSLQAGPNVLLNCTFRGRGSRIQPHMRWSTGLLVDNCRIPDGGIDFMNRGVMGSGHGWTMGWGVVWNSLAQTYVIQNPPGAANWCIGCRGARVPTSQPFDQGPDLPEGIFDSHGIPVAPRSLYLAQLAERLGVQALRNIGYEDNVEAAFAQDPLEPLPELKPDVDAALGPNLALGRPIDARNVRGETRQFGGEKAVDGDEATWWATNDLVSRPATLVVDLEGPVAINAVVLGEAAGMEHVQEYRVEGQVDSDWKILAEGTTIGERQVHRFPTVVAWKVRLTIVKAPPHAAIRKLGLYFAKS